MPRNWSYRKYERNVLAPPPKGISTAMIVISLITVVLLTMFIGNAVYWSFHQIKESNRTPGMPKTASGAKVGAGAEIRD